MPGGEQAGTAEGLVVVDKPAGWTSHDVVARLRRLAHTRRVGHAGTLDPMATGVLLVGVGRATRLLGHLALTDKDYLATVRLGQTTTTDDADGELVERADAAAVTEAAVQAALPGLTGDIDQVPPAYSAIKVAGRRSYARARDGEQVRLAARRVTVHRLALLALRPSGDTTDVDLAVGCSSGTYVRALARDLGAALGVGGHLVSLRRTRVGPYTLAQARTLEQLAEELAVQPLADVVAASFSRIDVDAQMAGGVVHGRPLPVVGEGAGPFGVFGPDGALLALVEREGDAMRYRAVFAEPQPNAPLR